jgi:hypothetical protein
VQAAIELFAEELDPAQTDQLQQDFKDLTTSTPRTPLAVSRFKKALAKVSKPIGDGIKEAAKDVIGEVIKRQIWPPGSP